MGVTAPFSLQSTEEGTSDISIPKTCSFHGVEQGSALVAITHCSIEIPRWLGLQIHSRLVCLLVLHVDLFVKSFYEFHVDLEYQVVLRLLFCSLCKRVHVELPTPRASPKWFSHHH